MFPVTVVCLVFVGFALLNTKCLKIIEKVRNYEALLVTYARINAMSSVCVVCVVQSTQRRWLTAARDGETVQWLQCHHHQWRVQSLSLCTGLPPPPLVIHPLPAVDDQAPLTTEIDDILTLVSVFYTVDSAFYPRWDGKLSISFRAE